MNQIVSQPEASEAITFTAYRADGNYPDIFSLAAPADNKSLCTLHGLGRTLIRLDDGKLPVTGNLLSIREMAENQTEVKILMSDDMEISRRIFCSASQLTASLVAQDRSTASGSLLIDVTDWPYLKGVPRYVTERDSDSKYFEAGTEFSSRPHIPRSIASPGQ